MSHEANLQLMSEDVLAQRCEQETDRYFKHLVHDTGYCFELFRRAIQDGSEAAWEIICRQYQALVTSWVNQHYAFPATHEEAEYFVNGVFGKIFGTIAADKFRNFADLGYLLRYLKTCVHSVIMDYKRKVDYSALSTLDDVSEQKSADPSPEDQVIDHLDRQRLWDLMRTRLHNEKERLVIHGLFVLDLKSQDVYENFQNMLSDVDEVYRIKQNVISRLRRDPELLKLLGVGN